MNDSAQNVSKFPVPVNLTEKVISRFWKHVSKAGPDDCWLWTGAMSQNGYGRLNINKRARVATRISWVIHNGPIPEGLNVLHDCPNGDNPSCVNPAHLWTGTHTENMADMANKGQCESGDRHWARRHPEKHAVGVATGAAKLKDSNVLEIRERHKSGESFSSIGRAFGVKHSAISDIVNGRRWRHVKY